MTLSGRSALVVVIGGIASLCLSLFLIGLIVGGVWRDHPHHPGGPNSSGPMAMQGGPEDGKPGQGGPNGGPGGGKGGGLLMMPVPPEIRAELEPMLQPHLAEIMKTRAAMRDARIGVGKALGAVPFDPAAFQAALDNMQQQGEAAQKLMHDLMVEAVPKLKPELRQRWAQRWISPRMDGPPPPGDSGPGDAPPPPPPQ